MKIVHTADLHLKKDDTETLAVFDWILKKATALKAHCIIISGDMFDSNTDATSLRPQIKRLCDNTPVTILIIPGNHDSGAFKKGYDYGKSVIQCTDQPFTFVEMEDIKLAAIPYQEKKFAECIKDVPSNTDILVAHGTLYDPSIMVSILDDAETKYMPIYPANLENSARYVAMGHLHARSIEKKYGKTLVVYPGSPVALDSKCVSERRCYEVVIEQKTISVSPLLVDIAPYYHKETYFVFAGNEEHIINKIEESLNSLDPIHRMPAITVKGYTGMQDQDFARMLDKLRSHFSPRFSKLNIANEVESWDTILEHSTVKRFIEKTKAADEAVRMKIFEIVLPIFSKLLK